METYFPERERRVDWSDLKLASVVVKWFGRRSHRKLNIWKIRQKVSVRWEIRIT